MIRAQENVLKSQWQKSNYFFSPQKIIGFCVCTVLVLRDRALIHLWTTLINNNVPLPLASEDSLSEFQTCSPFGNREDCSILQRVNGISLLVQKTENTMPLSPLVTGKAQAFYGTSNLSHNLSSVLSDELLSTWCYMVSLKERGCDFYWSLRDRQDLGFFPPLLFMKNGKLLIVCSNFYRK